MKFVTVMDMWLLIMNGILLGAILYYGRKLINLVARATEKVDTQTTESIKFQERDRILKLINQEYNIYSQAAQLGDSDSKAIAEALDDLKKQVVK